MCDGSEGQLESAVWTHAISAYGERVKPSDVGEGRDEIGI